MNARPFQAQINEISASTRDPADLIARLLDLYQAQKTDADRFEVFGESLIALTTAAEVARLRGAA